MESFEGGGGGVCSVIRIMEEVLEEELGAPLYKLSDAIYRRDCDFRRSGMTSYQIFVNCVE